MATKAKILIVDDDLRNLRILQEILSDDFEVEEVTNGTDALSKASEFMPDLILLDIMMPDIDGLEVCKHIRENNNLNFIKIILVSGKARQDEKLEGYKAGADDYITKPFDDDELLAKVKVFTKLKFAEEINQLKTNFLNLLSHEIGTPLHAITGFSSMLKNKSGFTDEIYTFLGQIYDAGKTLNEKINRLLFLSSFKDQSNCNKISIPVEDLIKGTLDFVAEEQQQKGIRINTSISEPILEQGNVMGCYELLQKALFYILENAVKFSKENSEINIVAKMSDDQSLCDIEIQDAGPGLSDDLNEKMFEEFNIPNILQHNSGLGISLAISKLIVQMHNGTIVANNNEGSGATFTVSLPINLK